MFFVSVCFSLIQNLYSWTISMLISWHAQMSIFNHAFLCIPQHSSFCLEYPNCFGCINTLLMSIRFHKIVDFLIFASLSVWPSVGNTSTRQCSLSCTINQEKISFYVLFFYTCTWCMTHVSNNLHTANHIVMLFSEDDRFCLFFSIFMFSIFFQGVFIFMAIDKPYSSALQLNLFDDSFYVSSLSSLHVIHYWLHSRREYISNIHVLFILLFTLRILFQNSQVSLVYCYQCVTY